MRGIPNRKRSDTDLCNEAKSWSSYSRATLCTLLCILAVSTWAVAQDANNANLVEKGRQILAWLAFNVMPPLTPPFNGNRPVAGERPYTR